MQFIEKGPSSKLPTQLDQSMALQFNQILILIDIPFKQSRSQHPSRKINSYIYFPYIEIDTELHMHNHQASNDPKKIKHQTLSSYLLATVRRG